MKFGIEYHVYENIGLNRAGPIHRVLGAESRINALILGAF
ncbi:hypothetical protein HMPREF9371_2397 [Neisseria shayeganii 871]|uniref:Uncharacterized protein n=1 Tax=Neisseria shayeganii 871 TaxID=1032488 RepID=G4CLA6_9NEIS|nr:hypothetical protein HMPREF9371_2397 [Neisseria shayeganii 871]